MFDATTSAAGGLAEIAHLIQLSLTPVFLLSGLAGLLGVFSTRLSRVADRVDQVAQELETAGPSKKNRLTLELHYQRRRTFMLDIAVVLGALGGGLTSASVLVLFIGALSGLNLSTLLVVLFAMALLSAVGALAAFVGEMLLASRGLRNRSRRMSKKVAASLGEEAMPHFRSQ